MNVLLPNVGYNKKDDFIEKISQATNSQKPIQPRDLKSNSKEMRILAKWLYDNKVVLDIKRGEKLKIKNGYRKIKNDELGQLILSFIFQQPGTSRSKKKEIFDVPSTYSKIFMRGYEKNASKKAFILDLIDLNDRYSQIYNSLSEDTDKLNPQEKIVLKNAKQIMFSLFGLFYKYINEDISKADLIANPIGILDSEFMYSSFIGNYLNDDLDGRIEGLIIAFTILLKEVYDVQVAKGEVTSVSNLFKSDKKYAETIVSYIISRLNTSLGMDIIAHSRIFKRK